MLCTTFQALESGQTQYLNPYFPLYIDFYKEQC